MSVYQQVLDFLKARGGVVNLRELRQFPNSILDTLHLHQYIEITGRIGSHEVSLICSEFKARDEKKPQPTQTIIKHKEPPQILKKTKVKPQPKISNNDRLERCQQVRSSIFSEIKNAHKPMSAMELKDKFPQIRPRAIAYHLKRLEKESLVCSIDWNTRLWTDIERECLLHEIIGTYIGRYENKNAVLNVLKNADEAMSVTGILRKLPPNQCSGTTLRKILELFITMGIVRAGSYVKSNIVYFALIDNSIALFHLNQLIKYKKRKLNSQLPLPQKNSHEDHN
jgi:hypothetical protein